MPNHVVYSTSLGCGLLVFNGPRLVRHLLPGDPRARAMLHAGQTRRGTAYEKLALEMARYFDYGEPIRANVEFDFDQTTGFALKVYNQAMEIGFGQVSTYGRIASAIGCGSSRAVGGALATNQLPLLVPCHRVVASDGLGGWSGPPGLKAKMLALEKTR